MWTIQVTRHVNTSVLSLTFAHINWVYLCLTWWQNMLAAQAKCPGFNSWWLLAFLPHASHLAKNLFTGIYMYIVSHETALFCNNLNLVSFPNHPWGKAKCWLHALTQLARVAFVHIHMAKWTTHEISLYGCEAVRLPLKLWDSLKNVGVGRLIAYAKVSSRQSKWIPAAVQYDTF